ncbi:hypothetical protein [Actinomycetospora soli]|uniref:hypothetical protein n=1 Tax=Actinomycetospora soli TaxID=2893887 RepID=UPI001E292E40|nr:hypothetical protein [Actinomycetospora soli]MCD2191009.1 hypothetical protein [Actinomycetospora soli]
MPGSAKRVKVFNSDKLDKRRTTILARVKTTEADLRDRGSRYALDAEELAAYEELRGLDYLRDGAQRPA